jgi:hypothetical protein
MTSSGPIELLASNWHAREDLLVRLKSRDAMAFIGAGVSMEIYKGWSDLLTFLGHEAKKRGFAEDDDIEFWSMQQNARPQQVARMIRRKYGEDGPFFSVLGEYFKERKHEHTGKSYTPLQEIIAKLPFKGVITTNYDPGLWKAFVEHRPAASSPPATWQDKDVVNKWNSRDIFRNSDCPILHIHGSWDKPSTIILDNERYREVYGKDYFKIMFQSLWRQEHLVLIGCGFADSWLDRSLDEVLSQTGETADVRHIALIGLQEENEKHVARYRDMMQNMYRSEILFYRIRTIAGKHGKQNDHTDLISVLKSILVEIGPKKGISVDVGPNKEMEHVVSQPLLELSDIKSTFSPFNRNF